MAKYRRQLPWQSMFIVIEDLVWAPRIDHLGGGEHGVQLTRRSNPLQPLVRAHLGGRVPTDLIHDGTTEDVIAVIDQIRDGVFV
jgi:hypothetical protein